MKIVPKPQGELSRVPPEQKPPVNPGLRKVSKQFEAVFIGQLVNAMRQTVPREGFIKQSQAERVFQGMLDQEYAQRISDSEQLGLSDLVYRHLLQAQSPR